MKINVYAMLSFGLVNVQVGVASGVSSTDEPTFVNLHDADHGRIGLEKVCKVCGELKPDTVKGFEYAKGEYAIFTEEEIAAVMPKRSPEITIRKFVKATELLPLMIEKSSFLVPDKIVNGAYGLLYQTLAELKSVGVGTHTLYGKEHPCAVAAIQNFPGHSVLMLYSLNVYADMNAPDFTAPIPSREDKKLAKQIIGARTESLIPAEDLVSESREALQAVIAAKVAGRELPVAESATSKEITTDLHEMLKRELAELAGRVEV